MTKEEILFDKIHYQVCNDCGISESGSTEVCTRNISVIVMYQSIDFAKWLSKNNWHYYEELDFFYQTTFYTKGKADTFIHSKERQELGSTLYEIFIKEQNSKL